ncbi:Glycogen phosphorylase [Phycisphaerae bacterium RAS1]|nr:Glycogen phosphorylase [Phycisphaerae bacterium RAS1]
MHRNIRTFVVIPSLPEPLEPLRQLAYNLWWSWTPPAADLFRRLDLELWRKVNHNPVALLQQIDQSRLEAASRDDAYMAQLLRVVDAFYIYMNGRTWFDEHYPQEKGSIIAYFSLEFGLHESIPIYSGGLGILAGDHLKSASDLGIPLAAVGLMYRQGYFQQQLTEDGWQLESYPPHDFHGWPVQPALDDKKQPVRITVMLGHYRLTAQVWRVQVGRVTLHLLDADIPENSPELRAVTGKLYGGDQLMRIRQEILLGIGGYRALRAVGITPSVCHMNEGHAAFLAIERVRQLMHEHQLSFRDAREAVAGGNLFTTHTPVPAGIDRFDPRLVEDQLGWMAGELGLDLRGLLAMGREDPGHAQETFCMPILALRMSYRSNGVSKLHGEVARGMWQSYWPQVPREEVPLIHVTNGIHTRSWTSAQMNELLEQYLGPNWAESPPDDALWQRIDSIPDAELWRVHVRCRERMIADVRNRVRDQLKRRGAPPAEVRAADEILDPETLTIGFARRFAPYKRATLLFRNPQRLAALLSDDQYPVQFIFAGKAHPADGAGKELIKQISAMCMRPEFRRRIVFLENYEMSMARELVQGVDMWLNNPLRLHEASGTSGMKVPPNGGLNLSCLDGWWPEAFNGENGWVIGDGRIYDDLGYQDHVEAESLYNLLEREIIPMFYRRTKENVPRAWLGRMKASMKTIVPAYSTNRMLRDYTTRMYLPALRRTRRFAEQEFSSAKTLATWKESLRAQWHQVRVTEVVAADKDVVKVGDQLEVRARVHLGSVKPEDVAVEAYFGPIGPGGEFTEGRAVPLKYANGDAGAEHWFAGTVPCSSSGQQGYAIRVVPNNEDLADRYDQGLVVWA